MRWILYYEGWSYEVETTMRGGELCGGYCTMRGGVM